MGCDRQENGVTSRFLGLYTQYVYDSTSTFSLNFAESSAVIFIRKWGAIDSKMGCDRQENGVTSRFLGLYTQYVYDSTSNFSLNFAESSAVIFIQKWGAIDSKMV
jgi:hypothetical protein